MHNKFDVNGYAEVFYLAVECVSEGRVHQVSHLSEASTGMATYNRVLV